MAVILVEVAPDETERRSGVLWRSDDVAEAKAYIQGLFEELATRHRGA